MSGLIRLVICVAAFLSGCNFGLWSWNSPTSVAISENTSGVFYTAAASHSNHGASGSYMLSGEDAEHFAIDPVSGEMSLVTSLNYERPQDADADNTYQVSISARVGDGGAGVLNLDITIEDMPEFDPPIVFPWPNSYLDNHIGEYIPFIFASDDVTEGGWQWWGYGPSGKNSGFEVYLDSLCVGYWARYCYDDEVASDSNEPNITLFKAFFEAERVLAEAKGLRMVEWGASQPWMFTVGLTKPEFSGDFIFGQFQRGTEASANEFVKVAEYEFRPNLRSVEELAALTEQELEMPTELRVVGIDLLLWNERQLWLSDLTLRNVELLLSLDAGQTIESVTLNNKGEVLILYGVKSAANGEIVHQVAKYSSGSALELIDSAFTVPGLQGFLLPREVALSFASQGVGQEFYLGGVLAEECLDNTVPGRNARAFVYRDGVVDVFDLFLQIEEGSEPPSMMGCIRNDRQMGMMIEGGVLAQLAGPPVYVVRNAAEMPDDLGVASKLELELTMDMLRLEVEEGAGSTFTDFRLGDASDISRNLTVHMNPQGMSSLETHAAKTKFLPSARFPAMPIELDESLYSRAHYTRLYNADGRISFSLEEPLTGKDYRAGSFDFHKDAHVIYSLGHYGEQRVPVISAHHLPSNTSAYLPLSEMFSEGLPELP